MIKPAGTPAGFFSFIDMSCDIESAVRIACLLDVTARKPGNVHPLAAFADCDWEAFAASAEAIAPVLAGAAGRSLGETILRAVEATRERVGRNTNLGMILLLAPLATVPPDEPVDRATLGRVLARTTFDDCHLVYEAIRLARPGGLGSANVQDVTAPPTVTLIEAMRLASGRDDVAKQYVDGFSDVLTLSGRFSARDLPALEREIVNAQLELLAARADTLIGRKCGKEVAIEATRLASDALAAGGLGTSEGRQRVTRLDAWLRGDGSRRNPGTTADLIAAGVFVAIRNGAAPCFAARDVTAYAQEIRRSGETLPPTASR
jgi:triphosphoribosyl-dephospho-CoA synthase